MNYCTDLYIQLMYATFHGQVKEFFEGDFGSELKGSLSKTKKMLTSIQSR